MKRLLVLFVLPIIGAVAFWLAREASTSQEEKSEATGQRFQTPRPVATHVPETKTSGPEQSLADLIERKEAIAYVRSQITELIEEGRSDDARIRKIQERRMKLTQRLNGIGMERVVGKYRVEFDALNEEEMNLYKKRAERAELLQRIVEDTKRRYAAH